MNKKIAVIGASAYLAENISNISKNVLLFSRADDWAKSGNADDFDWVINFSIQPEFQKKILPESELIDVNIAKIIQGMKTKFVMISSRKVYGTCKTLNIFYETDECHPADFYAKNKLATEHKVLDLLPEQSLIVRVSNIIDFPSRRPEQRVFMGWIRDSMREKGELNITENPDVKKDFITRDYFQRALRDLMNKDELGIFNVGAGFAVSLRELLPRIVGRGNCVFSGKNKELADQFILNTDKLHMVMKAFSVDELYTKCDNIRKVMFDNMGAHDNGKN
ncbi:MAG: GDP-mannose 4,6-dehydratase [Alphaproteobacteria bacterium]|nr:GDP-mannose 4,6-dehydratase [Alphaproteobacteria bacterium]